MKHLKAFNLILFLIFSSILYAPKVIGQGLVVDSTLVADSLAKKDSLARLAVFDSLDNALKNSQIILFPDKGINYLKMGLDSTVNKGSHDLLYGLESHHLNNKESTVHIGIEKTSRPA